MRTLRIDDIPKQRSHATVRTNPTADDIAIWEQIGMRVRAKTQGIAVPRRHADVARVFHSTSGWEAREISRFSLQIYPPKKP